MDTGLIARRYACALADFAESNGEMTRTAAEAVTFVKRCRRIPELREALLSPVLTPDAKISFVRRALDGELSESFGDFLRLVIRHRREKWLCFILPAFIGIYKERYGIVDVTLTTAAEVDDRIVERLAALVGGKTHNREVRMHRQIDPSLIGGFRLRMDDRLLDASLASQLRRLQQKLGKLPASEL